MPKTIYIDAQFRCSAAQGDGLTPVETGFFDGKCDAFIEGYRFIPEGESWTREDGVVFLGEMAAPWQEYDGLDAAQRAYEQAELEDMRAALKLLGVNADEEMD